MIFRPNLFPDTNHIDLQLKKIACPISAKRLEVRALYLLQS